MKPVPYAPYLFQMTQWELIREKRRQFFFGLFYGIAIGMLAGFTLFF